MRRLLAPAIALISITAAWAEPAITIVTANNRNAEVSLSTDETEFRGAIFIRATSTELKNVEVKASDLVSTAGARAELKPILIAPAGSQTTLDSRQPVEIALFAKLDQAGDYRAELWIDHGEQQRSTIAIPIAIQRKPNGAAEITLDTSTYTRADLGDSPIIMRGWLRNGSTRALPRPEAVVVDVLEKIGAASYSLGAAIGKAAIECEGGMLQWWRGGGEERLRHLKEAAHATKRAQALMLEARGDARASAEQVVGHGNALLGELRDSGAQTETQPARVAGLRQQVDLLEIWGRLHRDFDELDEDDKSFLAAKYDEAKQLFERPFAAIDATRSATLESYGKALRACQALAPIRLDAVRFRNSFRAFETWLGAKGERAGVADELSVLEAHLAALNKALEERNATAASASVRGAKGAYLALAAALAAVRLSQPAPWGVTSAEWQAHADDMTEAFRGWRAATPAADEALHQLLGRDARWRSARLRQAVESRKQAAASPELEAQWGVLLGSLVEPEPSLTAEAFEQWFDAYCRRLQTAASLAALAAGAPAVGPDAVVLNTPDGPPPLVDARVFSLPFDVFIRPPLVAEPLEYERISRQLAWVVFGLSIALTVLAGVQVLWIDSYAWGRPSDLVTALLFGIGAGLGSNTVLTELLKRSGTFKSG
ncbi:hypothetical protein B5U98_00095 [Bosea sp. Tri-39]|nr:hypothetical protein BLM15_18260 [Bosea sp. Tri-49]RXT27255.1 hypothetical protein B5U98_00095 [Bosea sp. Tri-39]RXT36039.1 hypothetical protein B5U99_17905 [Bosea sp. Tri-54]